MTDQTGTAPQPEILQVEEQRTAVVRGTARMDELTTFYDRGYAAVMEAVTAQGRTPSGAFGLYLSEPSDTVDLEVGFVVDEEVAPSGDVVASRLPAGEVARLTHVGAYDGLGESWGRLMQWLGEQGRSPAGPMWEVYVTEPTPEAEPSSMRTDLFCLLA